MMVGYTPQGGLQTYANEFAGSMGSFGDVRDAGVLDVKPARVKLVRLDAAMSVSDFMSKYPSSEKPELIALINGVPGGGQIPAGWAKQVVGGPGK